MSLHYLEKHEARKLGLTAGVLAFEGSVVTVCRVVCLSRVQLIAWKDSYYVICRIRR